MTSDLSWKRIVAEIEAVGSRRGRARLGLCSIEGVRLCERALRAGATVERAVVLPALLEDASERARALLDALTESGCELVPISEAAFDELTDGRALGGIVALARLPEPKTLADVLGDRASAPELFVACVSLNDPGNVGALVRTAHASRVTAILCVGSTDVFHPRSVRTSKGSVFRIPIVELDDFETMLGELRRAGVRTVGAVSNGGTPLPSLERAPRPTAVIVGSEAFGLSESERSFLDELVTIPMAPDVDSFSVNAAAAVVLYELRRHD